MAIQIAGGSVIGRDHHFEVKKNNQDAYHILNTPDYILAVVTDGCGSVKSPYSEVGAHFGGRILTKTGGEHTQRMLNRSKGDSSFLLDETFWERIRQDVLAKIRVQALQMGDSLSEIVTNYFLFTTVGVLITEHLTAFFSIGDVNLIINGVRTKVGPFPDNEPPYLCYGLVSSSVNPSLISFQLHKVLPTSELQHFLIGCDGVDKLIEAETSKIPGQNELVGSISQFWQKEVYFKNPYAITRRLRMINADKRIIDWDHKKVIDENGLLGDDTTLIVGRQI